MTDVYLAVGHGINSDGGVRPGSHRRGWPQGALIPELNIVTDYSREVNLKQGEALAAGICRFLGKPFVPGTERTMPVDTGHEWRAERDDGLAIGPFDRLFPMLDQLGPIAGRERDMTITLTKKIT